MLAPFDPATDTVLAYYNNSARDRAQRRFDATGERTSPWKVHPTRETYTEIVRFQRGFQREGLLLEAQQENYCDGQKTTEGRWSMARPALQG